MNAPTIHDHPVVERERYERDLAHEADMEQLRREQLRADVDDAEDYLGDPDEYDFE